MLEKGKRVRLAAGGTVLVGDEFARGGQAVLFRGWSTTGTKAAVKVFTDRGRLQEDRRRSEALVELRLHEKCPLLCGPDDVLARQDLAGHVAPYFDGQPLEQFLFPPSGQVATSLSDLLYMSALISHAIAVLHSLGISHGDIHVGQFGVRQRGGCYELATFDLDNFFRPDLPLPAMAGRPEYMAPEVRRDWRRGGAVTPTVDADHWSLAAVHNVVLLGRDPCPAVDAATDEFHAGASGSWLDDPHLPDRSSTMGGRPTRALSRALIDAFRRGINPAIDGRPTAADWRRECLRAASAVALCPQCQGEMVADERRRQCPHCRCEFPTLSVSSAKGRVLRLDETCHTLGRSDFGGAPTVSETHCVVARQPPLTIVTSLGKNGTFWFNGQHWVRLPDRRAFPVQPGDRLRMADIECEVRELG